MIHERNVILIVFTRFFIRSLYPATSSQIIAIADKSYSLNCLPY